VNLVATVTPHIPAGSIIGAGKFPQAVWLILHRARPMLGAALIAYRHKENIRTFGSHK
jgi:hypothetical protein